MALRHILLNSGAKMPIIGLGTHKMIKKEDQASFDFAVHAGYRLFDTAHWYMNEHLIGEVLQDNVQCGKVKRRDLFVTTKVPPVYLSPTDVKLCLEKSLENLKMTYVDLLLVHNQLGLQNIGNVGDGNFYPKDKNDKILLFDYDLQETWKAFESLVKDKRVKSIGLSNFSPSVADRIIAKAKIIPANLQFECSAFCQQHKLHEYCSKFGISMTAYSTFARTGRADDDTPVLLEDETVLKLAEKHRKTPSQILLRYHLQRGMAVIPRSSNPQRLKENLDLFDFNLDETDMKDVLKLDRNLKLFTFDWGKEHPNYPKNGEPF